MSEEATKQVITLANLNRRLANKQDTVQAVEEHKISSESSYPFVDEPSDVSKPKFNLVMPKRPLRVSPSDIAMPSDCVAPGPDARIPTERLEPDEVPEVFIDSSVNVGFPEYTEESSITVESSVVPDPTNEDYSVVQPPKRRGRPPKPSQDTKEASQINSVVSCTAPICSSMESFPEVKQNYTVQVQQEVHSGKTITVASLRFVGTPDATRVMELNLTPTAKMSIGDIQEYAAYKAKQYEHDIEQWGQLADVIIKEIDSIPSINYKAINSEIEDSGIEIKVEPSMHDCAMLLATINNRLSRLGLFKIRLTPIMSIYDTGKSLLSDTWSAISQKSSEGSREGEAKLILSRLILEYKKVKSLWDTLDMAMKRLEMSWQTVSRQVTALADDNIGEGLRKPVDIGDSVSAWDYLGDS